MPVSSWSVDDVSDFISARGFADVACRMREDEVDGDALKLARVEDLTAWGFKRGSALKIQRAVQDIDMAEPGAGSVGSSALIGQSARSSGAKLAARQDGKLYRGRIQGSPELFLQTKLLIVDWALEQKMIEQIPGSRGLFKKASPQQYVDTTCFGDVQRRKLASIRDWASDSVAEGWRDFSKHQDMQVRFGANPLAVCKRLPEEWCKLRGILSKKRGSGDGVVVSTRKRGRKAYKDKYPLEMLACQGRLARYHAECRSMSPPFAPDFETMYNTWHSVVNAFNREQRLLDLPTLKGSCQGDRFSWSYVRGMCIDLGLESVASGSAEAKAPEPEECLQFENEVGSIFQARCIDPRANVFFDEFSDIKGVTQRRVVIHESEKNRAGPQGNQKAHVPQTSSGRKSLSCGFLLTPTWIGRAVVITDTGSEETLRLIETELGAHVKVIKNQTGNMYGTTHAREFLPNFVGREVSRMKRVLQLPEDSPYFYSEDHAPGHYRDQCSVTGDSGLNEIRKTFFTRTNGFRKLVVKNGTPQYMVGDQLHHIIKKWIHDALDKLKGDEKDLTKLPETKLLRRGGLFVTQKGYKRGATLFLYCLAVAMARAKLSKYLVCAAFCKCGYYDIKKVGSLFQLEDDLLASGAAELDTLQEDLKRTHAWLHKNQDFSGQPEQSKYKHFGNIASLPLRGVPELRAQALDALRKEEKDRQVLLEMHARCFDEMQLVSQQNVDEIAAQQPIVAREKVLGAGALAQLSHLPDATNAAHREPFLAAMSAMFGNVDEWKKKPKHHNELVCDFELHLLRRRFIDLVDQDSSWARGKTVHGWVWGCLKKIHVMKVHERRSVWLRVVGDFKKYSLNPTGRKDPKHGELDAEAQDEPSVDAEG